jgi:hypothetical protein
VNVLFPLFSGYWGPRDFGHTHATFFHKPLMHLHLGVVPVVGLELVTPVRPAHHRT